MRATTDNLLAATVLLAAVLLAGSAAAQAPGELLWTRDAGG
jgi:hypothetical protein